MNSMNSMNSIISFFLDAAVIIAVVFPIVRGYRRGFKRCAFALLSLAVSSVAAFVVSDLFAQPVYERFFQENVRQMCLSAAEKCDPVSQISEILEGYGLSLPDDELRTALTSAESLPESVASLAEDYGADGEQLQAIKEKISDKLDSAVPKAVENTLPNGISSLLTADMTEAQIYDTARACAQSSEEAADYVEQHYAAPVCTALLKSLIFVIALVVFSLVMRLAFFIFGFDFSRRPDSFGDRFGGILLGAVKAAANLLLLTVAVGFVEQACTDYFNIETLNSKIFLPIFNRLY